MSAPYQLGQKASLTGTILAMDLSNGKEGDERALLPEGELIVTLHIKLSEQL